MNRQDIGIHDYAKTHTTIKILVKPSTSETAILGYDESKDAFRISVSAHPDKNKANIALIKFLTKFLKRPVQLVSGRTSKQKVVRIC